MFRACLVVKFRCRKSGGKRHYAPILDSSICLVAPRSKVVQIGVSNLIWRQELREGGTGGKMRVMRVITE